MADRQVYNVRITMLTALMSIYALWRKVNKEKNNDHDYFIKEFIKINLNNLWFWGEKASPQFIAIFWYLKTIDSTPRPAFLLRDLLKMIVTYNHPDSKTYLSNPVL